MRLIYLRPMLETADLRETIKFYTEMLGFVCQDMFPDDVHPVWASLQKDSVEIMFTVRNEHSTIEQPTMTGSLYFDPDDVDAIWEELKDKVTVEYPIENFDYGMREFAIRDCNGYLLQFGQEISES